MDRSTRDMEQGERRKWRRLDYELKIQLQVLDAHSGHSFNVIGTYLSPEGIFLQMSDPPKEDTRVRLRIGSDSEDSIQPHVEGVVTNQFVPSDATELSGVGVYLGDAGASWRKLYELLSSTPGQD